MKQVIRYSVLERRRLAPVSARARVVLVAALAALPLLLVVVYAAVDRYSADHARGPTRATNGAQLYATLLQQAGDDRPTSSRLRGLLELSQLPPASALVVFDDRGQLIARAGAARAGPSPAGAGVRGALRRGAGTFEATGPDGVKRVWGLASAGGASVVAFGLPGDAVYGEALTALKHDLVLAVLAVLMALLAALLLAGRVTAPIRRLAVRVGGDDGRANEIGAIERSFSALDEAVADAELQAVVNAALDAIVVFDDDMRIVSANDAAGRLMGRPAGQLIGLTRDQFVRSSDSNFALDQMRAQGSMESVVNVEFVTGEKHVLEVRGHPEFLPGRHLFVVRDVTERHQLEQQLRQAQKLEAVGQLAGGIAHDFNNLLTAITGYGAIARETIAGGPGADDLDEIEQAAQRAVQLTQQLLAFSRQQVLEPVVLDLHEVLDALMPMLTRLIGEDVTIDVVRGAGMPCVLADRGRIEQVIVNLAVNARDAMPTGGTLTIETHNRQLDEHYATEHLAVTPGRYACLTVSDSGTGIDREQLEHIFEPFFTTKDVDRGTGLGLATVHGIVTQSGGDVHVYSEPGIGTSFKVYLPATDATAPDPLVEGPVSARPAPVGSETILLCEDEDMVRRLTERMLAGHGYVVLASASPQEALDLAEQLDGPPAMLVTDVVMPGMSGPELAEQLEVLHPGLPTLFLSGYSAEVVRSRGSLPPGAVFIEKPFDRASLLQAVRGLLDRSQEVTSAT